MAAQLREREGELRRANQRLSDLASKDALTGIANRRGFDEQYAAEWNRARRAGESLALARDRCRPFQKIQRPLRSPGRRRLPAASGRRFEPNRAARWRLRGAHRRRGIRASPSRCRPRRRREIGRIRAVPGGGMNIAHKASPEARVTVSVGAAATRADRGQHARPDRPCRRRALPGEASRPQSRGARPAGKRFPWRPDKNHAAKNCRSPGSGLLRHSFTRLTSPL